jgi:hypothetical protein
MLVNFETEAPETPPPAWWEKVAGAMALLPVQVCVCVGGKRGPATWVGARVCVHKRWEGACSPRGHCLLDL